MRCVLRRDSGRNELMRYCLGHVYLSLIVGKVAVHLNQKRAHRALKLWHSQWLDAVVERSRMQRAQAHYVVGQQCWVVDIWRAFTRFEKRRKAQARRLVASYVFV
jgi:hypothetical protein